MNLLEAAHAIKFGSLRKLENYFTEYDLHLRDYRDRPLRLLEIGVQGGGSLAMWREYFPTVQVVGLDIDPACKQYETAGVSIYIGSQENAALLRKIDDEQGPFDIIIDDGGHTMKQQIGTFKTLFPLLTDDGLYVIEDLHTSYWPEMGAGALRQTTVEYLKSLVDGMHQWAQVNPRARYLHRIYKKMGIKGKRRPVAPSHIRYIAIADSIAFIRKGDIDPDKIISL